MTRLLLYIKRLLGWCDCHWGVPHADEDGKLIQTCYSCGKTRPVRMRLV